MYSDQDTDTFGKVGRYECVLEQKRAYYRQSVARKEEVTSFLRQKNYRNLSDNPNITVYTGTGSFVGPDVVEVRMAEETIQLQAQQIFVNTGAETIILPIGE